MKPQIIILIGPPRSGKTTWAKQHLKYMNEETIIVQKDGIFETLTGTRYLQGDYNEIGMTMVETAIAKALSLGFNVIYDACNSTIKELSYLIGCFENLAVLSYKLFDVEEEIVDYYNNLGFESTGTLISKEEIKKHCWNIDHMKYSLSYMPITSYIHQTK